MNEIKEIYTAVTALLDGQPDSEYSAREKKGLRQLAATLFQRATSDELSGQTAAHLLTRIKHLYKFIQQRDTRQPKLRIFNPKLDEDGWESPSTVIQLLNIDGPFLVDSISLLLAENGIAIRHLFHPVITVQRDQQGNLQQLLEVGANTDNADCFTESLIQLDIAHLSKDRIQRLKKKALETLNVVQYAVKDWSKMQDQARVAAGLLSTHSSAVDKSTAAEAADFINWLADDHFIFLGYREYAVTGSAKKAVLQAKAETGLGMLAEKHAPVTSRPMSDLPDKHALAREAHPEPLIITKTNSRSIIHRSGYMDYIGVKIYADDGLAIGEHRFIGLFTSNTYTRSAWSTPLLRHRVEAVMQQSTLRPGSHAWKALVHILETLPRDELFQSTVAELSALALGVLKLQERQRIRLFIRRERFGRFYSCMLYLPRDRFNTENRIAIQSILKRALKAETLDYQVKVSESTLARLHILVRPRAGKRPKINIDELEQRIIKAVRSWADELREILIQKLGEAEGLALYDKYAQTVSASYAEDVSPWVASYDLQNIAALAGEDDLRMSLYRPRKKRMGVLRFKIFKHSRPIPLSDVLPMLENLGLKIVSERPYEFVLGPEKTVWVQDFDMVLANGGDLDIEAVRNIFQQAFEETWRGGVESDSFNRLVLASRLPCRQVAILRAYSKYLLQTGMPFSHTYMAETLESYPLIARLLVEQFKEQFDPARIDESEARALRHANRLKKIFRVLDKYESPALADALGWVVRSRIERDRKAHLEAILTAVVNALELVGSLDQDRIMRAFSETIGATLRTNYFCQDDNGTAREFMSFKLDSARVPDLPKPCPYREIWVYSPRVEGIHLRMGKVARGGLRWSDRREDFRTEVLGLMKAQNVKNTMIVPVGAKGGFFVKQSPGGSREAVLAEGIYCYKNFIRGLLDVTDNLDEDKTLPPPGVVRRDDDDPYLVVAADKGTAAFSDIANGISTDYNFWLSDAFASGGSVGYDHKAMGITAKGAWESVRRHFREINVDIQTTDFTVVGIGDMAGDVFGNGMLLSEHICLKAAFNHMHIFLDPDPDAKISFVERQRLFNLPGSSWEDYNQKLISKGGGIFSRQAKTIELSDEMREWLGVKDQQMAPTVLIKSLLTAQVDLLWNGGIGTYVKSAEETDADVGDTANNILRINGKELNAKVVGEGGNLGFTQLGRIEYALSGGRINSDFIDNSAGVDCSDHEVNIKILLNQVMHQGKLDMLQRNALLVEMTADVDQLVLRSNYLQSQTISMMVHLTGTRLGAQAHFIRALEQDGLLDREIEFLPADDLLEERRLSRKGLSRPELAVLLSYAKIVLYQQLLDSDVPEDDYLGSELHRYFPQAIQQRFPEEMQQHRLKREIIATMVTNSMVNRMGASFGLMMQQATGSSPSEVAKAYTIVRDTFNLNPLWLAVEALDNKVSASAQTDALVVIWTLTRHATRWLLVQPGKQLDIQIQSDRLKPGIQQLRDSLPTLINADEQRLLKSKVKRYTESGFPADLAEQLALFDRLPSALDIVDEAGRRELPVEKVASVYYQLGQTMNLKWLMQQIEGLAVDGYWHASARSNLREELYRYHRALAGQVLAAYGSKGENPVEHWLQTNQQELDRVIEMLADMRTLSEIDFATISVAVQALRALLTDSSL
ncbi:MAG: NAD-glutamate dehydrogenase [Xanthomonadales bacterium]|nr:NAD-glutamate dehydrogenase [Xanthomonadales bacterium]